MESIMPCCILVTVCVLFTFSDSEADSKSGHEESGSDMSDCLHLYLSEDENDENSIIQL